MSNTIGVILASHGAYCEGARDSLEMIIGKCEHLTTVSVVPTMNPTQVQEDMCRKVEELKKDCEEILIFTDLVCGTPNNVAARIMLENENITLVSGYNLAILVEIINRRNNSEQNVQELLSDIADIHKNSLRIMKKEM